ncbi:MAG: hypothetical protein ACLU3I_03645 [Acutalibacteraceae bacterium]
MLTILLLAVCLFLFIFLLCAMGHKEGVDGIYQCWLNKIPLDLFLALLALLAPRVGILPWRYLVYRFLVLYSSRIRHCGSGADAPSERCRPGKSTRIL